jgi:3'5'-cyclic nucleotide phosphodiesterase
MYRNNPFHNFEHAGHVTMSVSKLLARIVAPDNPIHEGKVYDPRLSVEDRTYGITSDKLKQFTIVFCGLIHDVDHQGVPNFVLAKEDERLNSIYKGQAIAEQNSVEMAWDILMSPEYEKLRDCIYTTTLELRRFRQLIVNTIVATDIFDKNLAEHRRARWDRAFSNTAQEIKSLEDVSRKSSVVVEHIIQASDVAHTMQHWQIYQKFNKRLFYEMDKAFKEGRTDKDPSEGWYLAELGFFDNYIIPLAKKLKDCGVFGVSSDEYLNYALQNRLEWSNKGQGIVRGMKETAALSFKGATISGRS